MATYLVTPITCWFAVGIEGVGGWKLHSLLRAPMMEGTISIVL